MPTLTPQTEILAAFLRGESLTVLKAWQLYHTSELRRAVSRLNKQLAHDGKMIVGEKLNENTFKTYWLCHSLQLALHIKEKKVAA